MSGERFRTVGDNRPAAPTRLMIEDAVVVVRSTEDAASAGVPGREHEQEFEVVGMVEDRDFGARYAVCYCRDTDELVVTDEEGGLVEDEELARKIVESFFADDGTEEEDA